MRVLFGNHSKKRVGFLCEATLVFEDQDGPLAGLTVRGFGIWRTQHGELWHTVPSFSFTFQDQTQHFQLMDFGESDAAAARARFEAFLQAAYKARSQGH